MRLMKRFRSGGMREKRSNDDPLWNCIRENEADILKLSYSENRAHENRKESEGLLTWKMKRYMQ